MLRRWEMYRFAEGVTEEQIANLAAILRGSGRYIPELLDSAVGRNLSDAEVTLAWEHAYESPEAYARYMRHPYHISVLDRYLVPDSPEVITHGSAGIGLGLIGYEIDGAPFRCGSALRRVVAFKFLSGLSSGQIEAEVDRIRVRSGELPELRVSVVAPNSMGLAWWPAGWTHIWEQAYDDEDAMARVVDQEGEVLGPLVESSVSVHYRIDPAHPDELGVTASAGGSGPVYLVEQVDVAPDDGPEYLAALEELYLPITAELGMDLTACWHSPLSIGEDVAVMTTFKVEDWGRWDELRGRLVMHPAMPKWIARKRELVRRGRRTFYQE